MNVRLLGAHNCESLTTRLSSLLVDGILALDAGSLTSALSLPAQQKLRAVFLTHKHFDHTRDILTLAMNFYFSGSSINIYATSGVCEALAAHLLDGDLYPDFRDYPRENPAIKFNILQPLKEVSIEGYSILPIPVSHSVSAVGYQVTSIDGKVLFYTGDTGTGLNECWQQLSPQTQLLIIELTGPDRFEESFREVRHLTPRLLKQELVELRKLKGSLPQLVTVHMNPVLEEEIRREVAAVSKELDHPITLGYEGMEIKL